MINVIESAVITLEQVTVVGAEELVCVSVCTNTPAFAPAK